MAPDAQRRALDALLATLTPAALEVPARLVPLLSSGWSGSNDRQYDIEIFETAGGPVFDSMVAAEVAASVTLNTLLAPERLNRLAEQDRLDRDALGADELIDRLIGATFPSGSRDPGGADLRQRVATTTALALARVQRQSDRRQSRRRRERNASRVEPGSRAAADRPGGARQIAGRAGSRRRHTARNAHRRRRGRLAKRLVPKGDSPRRAR